MRKQEEVEVAYCDICNKREDHTRTISRCWGCGKDVCSQHHHLMVAEYPRRHTYVCDECFKKMNLDLEKIFESYSTFK